MSLPDALFMIEHNLCKEYVALTPFDLDERTFREVIKLFSDCKSVHMRQDIKADPDREVKVKVKAGDNWF